ncbi:MAG: BlaI/MecI/CopY family transcriptional regulator [Gemmatimonadales bacterium]|nr:MAG: BlaI/MecI/CopY family transcriptional regulator [Gemmatimonadales bacterium]
MKREAIFTDRELDVMHVLWDRKSGTVGEVQEQLDDPLAYTTVLTVLRTLEDKGFVGHTSEGRAYRYFPVVDRSTAQRSHLDHLVRKLFSGSPSALVDRVVELPGFGPEEARRVRDVLEARLNGES